MRKILPMYYDSGDVICFLIKFKPLYKFQFSSFINVFLVNALNVVQFINVSSIYQRN